uniref:Reverse transcriptase domain-containing protein n=1 Tax=Rhodnius prolixus TaxID=13249 RepID=T1H9W9_RHOPR
MPLDSFLVGYADDIAAIIVARDVEDAQLRLNQVMRRTQSWMEDHELELATEKTDVLMITRRHIPTNVRVQVGALAVETKSNVKYLG